MKTRLRKAWRHPETLWIFQFSKHAVILSEAPANILQARQIHGREVEEPRKCWFYRETFREFQRQTHPEPSPFQHPSSQKNKKSQILSPNRDVILSAKRGGTPGRASAGLAPMQARTEIPGAASIYT
ncbi:MAG: hypothetical protein LAP21_08005 [Acidobacteriia bacterium]|nr:hypothetical protein [Terriglobia bacterium]